MLDHCSHQSMEWGHFHMAVGCDPEYDQVWVERKILSGTFDGNYLLMIAYKDGWWMSATDWSFCLMMLMLKNSAELHRMAVKTIVAISVDPKAFFFTFAS